MSEPIVYVSKHKIKEGKLESLQQFVRQGVESLKANKPRTVAFLAYLNDAGTEVTFVHVYPDAEAMELHMQGASERAKASYEFLEPISMEIYGKPSDQVLRVMEQAAGPEVALNIQPQHLGGFLRLTSG